MYIYIYSYICIHIYIHIYIHVYLHIYIYCIYIYMYICIYLYGPFHVYMYLHIYIREYLYIYVHIHVSTPVIIESILGRWSIVIMRTCSNLENLVFCVHIFTYIHLHKSTESHIFTHTDILFILSMHKSSTYIITYTNCSKHACTLNQVRKYFAYRCIYYHTHKCVYKCVYTQYTYEYINTMNIRVFQYESLLTCRKAFLISNTYIFYSSIADIFHRNITCIFHVRITHIFHTTITYHVRITHIFHITITYIP